MFKCQMAVDPRMAQRIIKVFCDLFWTIWTYRSRCGFIHTGTIEALIQEGIKLVEDSKISSLAKNLWFVILDPHWIHIGTKDGNMMKYI